VPFIWRGTLAQFSGFALMPFALLVLAGKGESGSLPLFVGQGSAAIAFLLVGVGVHTVQTAGLALATDLTPEESHPRVVGMMYVMLLAGMMISALAYGAALVDFTPGRLVQVIQSAAVVTMLLNGIALWKQETRRPQRGAPEPRVEPSFREAWTAFCAGDNTLRRLFILGLGTLAFAMADILLEPFGGQVLNMTVSSTTRLTALFAVGGLLGFGVASHVAGRGTGAYPVVFAGALIGLPAFALVMIAAPWQSPLLFMLGNFLIGFGGALFWHGTLTAMMNTAPRNQIGLAIGAWGAVQATAAGIAMASSGIIRDVVDALSLATLFGSERAAGYMTVYALEIALLLITLVAALPLLRSSASSPAAVPAAGTASEATT
jgi:BCD family chlorophyll transporter-like MFS transporter